MKKPVPRIAAIHDLSGFGRASLTVVIPILSSMGIQVCPLPTVVLSTHSKYSGFHFQDMTEHLNPIIDHWKSLNLDFDAIYSGFPGSHNQIVTSVPESPDMQRTKVIAYNVKDDRFWKVSCNYLPANFPGTGDAFTSVITGSLLQGDSLPIALDRAVHFTSYGVRATFGYDYDTNEGIVLERILNHLDAPVQNSSYELLQ